MKLNYLKWLTQGIEIDMFEILSVFIIYTRAPLEERLNLLFRLYCYEGEVTMQMDEFRFMMDKLSVSISSTLSVKKTMFLEIVRSAQSNFRFNNEKLTRDEFAAYMLTAFNELGLKLGQVMGHLKIMGLCAM
jgi:hypothetical protein